MRTPEEDKKWLHNLSLEEKDSEYYSHCMALLATIDSNNVDQIGKQRRQLKQLGDIFDFTQSRCDSLMGLAVLNRRTITEYIETVVPA